MKVAGVRGVEAQDVVQETVLSVAKKMGQFKTDPMFGSFKNWLLERIGAQTGGSG